MTKTIAIALVASLGFVGAASAASDALTNAAQEKLDTYGFAVDAASLSDVQISQLNFVDESSDDDANDVVNAARAKTAIRGILN